VQTIGRHGKHVIASVIPARYEASLPGQDQEAI